jgi:DNA-3-methyladenine glycosylase II
LQEGVREIRGLSERPRGKELAEMCETWRPWRTVGTWYTWRRNTTAPIAAAKEKP